MRIIQVTKYKKGIYNYIAFSHGDHTEARVTDNSRIPYEDNHRNDSKKTEKNVGKECWI